MPSAKQTIIAPGLQLGAYPEKPKQPVTLYHKVQQILGSGLAFISAYRAKRYQSFIHAVNAQVAHYKTLSAQEKAEAVHQLRAQFSLQGITEKTLADGFAIACVTSEDSLQKMPFATQILAARIMFDGYLAEMATGEGKTLASGLCAAVTALSGSPVHLITANDYLVQRDSAELAPWYHALGLRVGTVTQAHDARARQVAYQSDITYVTAKELVFDYLRDHAMQATLGNTLEAHLAALAGKPNTPLLRGLCVALIDEADSILLDEACVPLILSRAVMQEDQLAFHAKSMELASRLTLGQDFTLHPEAMRVSLTDIGRVNISQLYINLSHIWHNRLHREETICMALAAQYLYHKDQHYLVRDHKIHIIDSITGRLATGRVWSQGLHQMIELKEQCQPSNTTVTLSQITYQRFFQRYYRIGGMSGTLREARCELWETYGLHIITVPLRLPDQRINLGITLYNTQAQVWSHVATRIKRMQASNRPILIGTDSVAASEQLSSILQSQQLAHIVLNARQDAQEASIIQNAGRAGQITVSTNMAGRGTDIHLDEATRLSGGLHVICCQHNTARRVDRQLIGRAARQGNPGSVETVIAIENPMFINSYPSWLIRLLRAWSGSKGISKPQWLIRLSVRLPQWLAEAEQTAQRTALMQQDAREDDTYHRAH